MNVLYSFALRLPFLMDANGFTEIESISANIFSKMLQHTVKPLLTGTLFQGDQYKKKSQSKSKSLYMFVLTNRVACHCIFPDPMRQWKHFQKSVHQRS